MSPRKRTKRCFLVEALEGRMALSSGALTSGLEGVRAVPAVVAPEAGETSTARPTLRLGDRGEQVKYLQQTLVQIGYSVGPAGVDGIFGPDTQGAVKAFQRDHPPLAVDGIVGPQTWAALGRATPPGGTLSLRQIKDQLARGFRDAGRSDLAQMVYTNDFYLWIQRESGWNPRAVSPPNNHGLSNDGLFQIWRGHPFNRHGEVSRMSPYQQAQTVARYFPQLTPQKIHHYADQIRAGTYKGWG